ncbi:MULTISPECIES: metal ABC transporter solute-binding protein, Zn/Mn family [unclassified Bartonella]|uniref:metal ABC transporter solute-binding protein, Zn/Mn family n=1 Tax=unclassified Bartonella TaxID=2645622 RepID=UPI00099A02F5|nr:MULTISPECIES: zinc ABC transporter substrate-binding protein [unclassified Bartonella]AQX28332.1 zinc/manganese transport system substrate-binding protein [Bartonella sp. JB15]AQX29601.1 zinc/manganese transport system substrate-binding protein [Bartonella sp. JB63]
MHKFIKQFVLLNSLLLLLFPLSVTAHQKINVVASFSIIADLVKNVGGDYISITTLVGPNASIHSYEPTPHDAKTLKNAHIIFINGLHLEGFINRLTTATGTKALLVEVSANISPFEINEIKYQKNNSTHRIHHHGSIDPHAWQTIPNVEIYIKNIAIAFCKIDQQSCENYNKNARIYIQKLKAMHATITKKMSTLPKDKRTIITSHDAFGYFAHEYNLTILAPESASKEATAADVAKLIKQIKNNKVSALFVENISNPRLIEQISKETGLKIGGILYSDALSGKEGPAATYLDMMEYNVNTIINAITKLKTHNITGM